MESSVYNPMIHMVKSRPFRLTPFMITLGDEDITEIDMQNMIELGMHIIRFRMVHVHRDTKIIQLLKMLSNAVQACCEKNAVSSWSVARAIDVANALIKTGYTVKLPGLNSSIVLKENSIIRLTCDSKYWNRVDDSLVCIDDKYTFQSIKVGTEISIGFGTIVMYCIKIINHSNVLCKVYSGGALESLTNVCIRGVCHQRPSFSEDDMEVIKLAKKYNMDIVIINSVRHVQTLKKTRKLFNDGRMPLIFSTICEQEGLENIDEIIAESDGIILGREYLANEVEHKYCMLAVQLQVGSKCKMLGKPFFISGNFLEESEKKGLLCPCESADVTNAVLQGNGLVLQNYPEKVTSAMVVLDKICRAVEPASTIRDFWRLVDELKMPVNAAEACVLACAAATLSLGCTAIVPTVTGRTAMQLIHILPDTVVITVSSNENVARQMRMFRGVVSAVYDIKDKKDKDKKSFQEDMLARINYGIEYGVKQGVLKYADRCVALHKYSSASSYCDCVSFFTVLCRI